VTEVTKSERQRELLEIISARRFETIPNLAHELGVSRYTVMRDLDEVTSTEVSAVEGDEQIAAANGSGIGADTCDIEIIAVSIKSEYFAYFGVL
jgi:predicted DNA-binding transcriptional regulator YafY